ncbi:MAG: MmcQ/YjbR family DNA-binding protein [Polyangiaceae bacterium]
MLKRTPKAPDIARAEQSIADAAAAYPEVIEEGPWGHRAFKVRGKTFLFLGASGDGLSFSVKLPQSGKAALRLSFTEPTHYGLGKSGWVTASFSPKQPFPLPTILGWLEESFRAIAPKALSAALASSTKSSKRATPAKKAPAKKAPAKKAPSKQAASRPKKAAKRAK